MRDDNCPPIIGVTCARFERKGSSVPMQGTNAAYLEAVEAAGGVPLLVPLLEDERALKEVCDLLDGLLLPGGGDVDPAMYGEECTYSRGCDRSRDEVERTLVQWATSDEVPLLGICRGNQLLNVALGGSLYQDIESEVGRGPYLHYDPERPRPQPVHPISVAQGTLAAEALGELSTVVNSIHHQAIKRLGEGLVETARADDGIVEAVERSGSRFCLGVQFHAEEMWRQHEPSARLFRAFVAACAGERGHGPRHK